VSVSDAENGGALTASGSHIRPQHSEMVTPPTREGADRVTGCPTSMPAIKLQSNGTIL